MGRLKSITDEIIRQIGGFVKSYIKIFVILLIALSLIVPAHATLVSFRGYTSIDNTIAPNLAVSAYSDANSTNLLLSRPSDASGYYIIDLDSTGTIYFKVADLNGGSGDVGGGGLVLLNLSANSSSDGSICAYNISCSSGFCVHNLCRASNPFCGDNICDAPTENNANCQIDCPIAGGGSGGSGGGSSGGGGGGGSGGGSSSTTTTTGTGSQVCEPNWNCTEWSVCEEGNQIRTCFDSNSCNSTVERPSGQQSCSSEEITQENPSESSSGAGSTSSDIGSSNPEGGLITGFATALTENIIPVAIAAAILVLLVIYLLFKKFYPKTSKKPKN